MLNPLFVIDVAHPPRHPDVVEKELLDALMKVKGSSSLRVLKIIHGHGSSGKGGSTKDVVRNWLFRHRSKFRTSIDGEQYSVFDADVQELRTEVGQYNDSELGSANPGLTIVWVK
jgi:hypothetical protein